MLGLSLGLNAGVNVRRPVLFTPASLSGLAAWYDLQDESTVNLVNGNEVDSIVDKSGNGWDLSYVSTFDTSLRDLYGNYFNGKKSISVADEPTVVLESGHYENLNFPALGANEREIFYVGKSETNLINTAMATIGLGPPAASTSVGMGISSGKVSESNYGTRVIFSTGQMSFSNDVLDQILSCRLESGKSTLSDFVVENSLGVLSYSTIGGAINSVDTSAGIGFFIRIAGQSSELAGRVLGEFVVFDRVLTSEERAKMFTYLHSKWDAA